MVLLALIALDIFIGSVDVLRLKLSDPDEKVRAAVCKVYSQLDYETALHHVSEAQLRSVAGRGADKKVCHLSSRLVLWLMVVLIIQELVRVEALNALGKLYSLAYPEMCVSATSSSLLLIMST
jgi:sister-chromatid-cohesion protein PDS5